MSFEKLMYPNGGVFKIPGKPLKLAYNSTLTESLRANKNLLGTNK